MAEQKTIKLIPYSKEKFPQTKTINGVPVEEATKKYQTVKVITDEQGKPVRTGEDYFIDEQGNPLKPKELQEITISSPAHLSDEEYRQYLLNSQDFNRRQGLPINYDNIPLFTYDNGITGKRNVNRNTYERYIAADNKSRAFNKQMDAIVAGATGIMASPYLLGAAAPWITTTFAPGTVGGNILGDTAGMIAIDETSKALTGRTTGQHIGDALGLAEDSNWRYATDFANPINIMGPGLLRKGISSGINYAENLSKNLEEKLSPAINFYTSGRLKGLYDGLKLYSAEQLQANPSKQFVKFQERPSKLTKKELLGIPKGERNQPLNAHLKGDNAVIMFKEYGSDVTIPDSSINYNILLKYVPEARERYGIVDRKDISDEEIARALYKRIQGLSKETGALNEVKEPQLLFRGDTRNYNSLKIRMTPTQLIDKKGTMDNSLGTIFLGEYPGTLPDRYDAVGVTRYLSGKVYNPIINEWQWRASSTIPTVPADHTPGYRVFFEPSLGYRRTPIGFVKDLSTAQYPNHLNAFIVKTPYVRDATKEISVLGDDAIIAEFDKAQYRGKQILDQTKDYSDSEIRKLMGDHYTQVLKDAEAKQQGLLRSDAGSPLREEHTKCTYFVVPNFNRFNVKHILPYDLRIPVDWSSHNIYRKNGGKLIRYFNK